MTATVTHETHETNGKGNAHALPKPPQIQAIECAVIDPSPTQPRKTFKAIEELAADIEKHGVLEPILVRPHPTKKERFELVYGERRLRATKHGNFTHIPGIVRLLSDSQVIDLQSAENAQREDIHPLEEADWYSLLHEKYKFSVEEIAAKVAKSVHTIYARLKFCSLIPEAREAFLADKMTAAVALMIARIPDPKLQKEALKEVGKPNWRGDLVGAREASSIIQQRFMLRLVDAPFDRGDATLVAAAGACNTCPKRSGNQRELFSDVEKKDDLCSDPKCFTEKRDAEWKRRVDAAPEKKQEILSAKDAKEIFYSGGYIKSGTYVDLTAKHWSSEKTNAEVLAKTKKELPVKLARDGEGGIHELVDARAFKKATESTSKNTEEDRRREESTRETEAQTKLAQRERAKVEKEIVEIVAAVERRQPNDALWRAVAVGVARSYDFDVDDVWTRRGLELPEKDVDASVTATIGKMTGAQARGVVVELLLKTSFSGREALKDFRAVVGGKSKAKK